MTESRHRTCFLAAVFCAVLVSCPAPFETGELSLLQDAEPPEVIINTPVQGSEFESAVTVSGIIVERDGSGNIRAGNVSSFIVSSSWDILDNDPATTSLTPASDGSFSFSFPSADLDSQITVVVSAEDLNGNIGVASITLVPDTTGPFLVVTSPEQYDEYSTAVILSGSVTNSLNDVTTSEVDPEIGYQIPGTAISGTTGVDPANGSFSKTINVSALDGSRTIEVTATDLNGNETTAVITIVKPVEGGDISGLTVVPANRRATITWNDVTLAESYSIDELRLGDSVSNVTSPYVWEGLENGQIYSFQVIAHLPAGTGDDAYSSVVTRMLLSESNLAPWVSETGHGWMEITWRDSPTISEYVVARAPSAGGPWKAHRYLTSNSFVDTQLQSDVVYYYRVSPSAYPDTLSEYSTGVPSPFVTGSGQIVGSAVTAGVSESVFVSGDYAYVTQYGSGLRVFRISAPGSPVRVADAATADSAHDVAIDGDYAFIAADEAGLVVLDISSPWSPVPVGTGYNTGGSAKAVDVAGDYAYVADYGGGLVILDVSNPAAPDLAGTYPLPTFQYAHNISVQGDYAFISKGTSGLEVVDISNKAIPEYACTYPAGNSIWDVVVAGGYAYVADGGTGLKVLSTSSLPGSLSSVGSRDTDGAAADIAIFGDYAYIADSTAGVQVIDISDPSNPSIVGTIDTPGSASSLVVSAEHLFVADYGEGLQVLGIANPSPVTATGSCSTDGVANGIAWIGDYVYIAQGKAGSYPYHGMGLSVVDVSSPAAPSQVGFLAMSYWGDSFTSVDVRGTLAFIAGDEGMYTVDVSDPAAPVLLGENEETYIASYSVALSGDLACLGKEADAGTLEVEIYDISDPQSPVSLGGYETGNNVYDVEIVGDTVFAAVDGDGLVILNISTPSSPSSISTTAVTSTLTAKALQVVGDYAFVAVSDGSGNGGIDSIDISVPTTPFGPYHCAATTTADATDISVSGDYAFVTFGDELVTFDISDPEVPVVFGDGYATTNARGVLVAGRYAYLTSDDGLTVLRLGE